MADMFPLEIDDAELRAIFVEEAREQIEILDQGLVRLERDPENIALIQDIFRAAHTLKGSSGAMGFVRMAELTHAMEDIFDRVRAKTLDVSAEITDQLLHGLDCLRKMEGQIEAGQDHQLDSPESIALVKLLRSLAAEETALPEAVNVLPQQQLPALPDDQLAFLVNFTDDCHMPAIRAFMVLRTLEKYGDILQIQPTQEEIDRGEIQHRLLVVLCSDTPDEILRNAVNMVSEVEWVRLARGASAEGIALNMPDRKAPRTTAPAIAAPTPDHAREVLSQSTMRINVDSLDHIMNLIGELVLDRTRVAQIKEALHIQHPHDENIDELDLVSHHISSIIDELHEQILQARMLPVGHLFNRFPRLVRDLCRSMCKEIDLVIEGESELLDRTIIERLIDPITHILRNAVDHGMESPDLREQLGKSRCGTIRFSARRQEEHILLSISDNGPGLDVERLKQKALGKGVISPERARTMSDQEAHALIMTSGLSTTEVVSDVSGRGVGMDVVKKNLDSLGGMIIVQSEKGVGTTFLLTIPLTLAIMRALIVDVGEVPLAIPLSVIEETLRVRKDQLHTVQGQAFLQWRNQTIPVIHLGDVFHGCGARQQTVTQQLVVVRFDERYVCFTVDNIRNHQDIVIRPLGAYLGEVAGLAGGTILGSGRIALILDIGKLFSCNFQLISCSGASVGTPEVVSV